MLRRMVGCQETAADLAQEAYIRLARVPTSQVIVSPLAFLFRTAMNLALDHFRKEKFRGQRQTSLEEADVKACKLDAMADKALRVHTSGQSTEL